MLTLRQLISLNLRLGQRLILKVGNKQSAIGLRKHMEENHRCSPIEKYKIDFISEAFTDKTHPHLFVKGCPSQYFDSVLFRQINDAIEIEDNGGLGAYCGSVGIAHLPFRVVDFYQEVLNARDRFLAERDSVLDSMRAH